MSQKTTEQITSRKIERQKEQKAAELKWDVGTGEPNSCTALGEQLSKADSAVGGNEGAKSVTFYVIGMNCNESRLFHRRAN